MSSARSDGCEADLAEIEQGGGLGDALGFPLEELGLHLVCSYEKWRKRTINKDSAENVIYAEVQKFGQVWMWLLLILLVVAGWWGFVQQIILGKAFGNNPAPDLVMWIIWVVFALSYLPTGRCRVVMVESTWVRESSLTSPNKNNACYVYKP